jgi:MFS transporter, DHA2 family, multidrug resistance protein
MAVGLSCLIYTLEEGQRNDWLGSELIQRTAIVALVFTVLFVIREFFAKYPLVNLRLFGRRNFGLGSIANVALGISLYGSVYLIPLYLTLTQGYSASQIGQVLIWSGLPQLLITPLVPKLMSKIDTRLLVAFGFALFAISCGMNSFMSHDYAADQLVLSMVVRAVGQPFIMVPLSALSTADIEPEQTGSASALFNMMRNLGGSVGIAVASTLVTQREQMHSFRIGEHITDSDPAYRQWLNAATQGLHHAGSSTWSAHQQALQSLADQVRRESFVMAFNDAFLAVALILAIGAVVSLLLKKPTSALHAGAE